MFGVLDAWGLGFKGLVCRVGGLLFEQAQKHRRKSESRRCQGKLRLGQSARQETAKGSRVLGLNPKLETLLVCHGQLPLLFSKAIV